MTDASFKILLVLAVICVFSVSCGIKAGPYLPLQILPKPVKKFQVFARSEGIFLRFRAPRENTNDTPLLDLDGFRIYRADTVFEKICLSCPRDFGQIFDYNYAGPKNKVPERTKLFYKDTALQFKNMYTYRLQPYNESGDAGGLSKPIDVYWDAPPLKPENVRAEKSGRLTTVSWDPPLSYEDGTPTEEILGFNLYRSEKNGVESLFPLNSEVIKETAVEDIPPKDDIVYYYSARAVRKVKDSLVESASSSSVTVSYMDVSPPGIPKGLAAIPVDEGLLLKWVPKAEKDFSGFNVYRKTGKENNFIKMNSKLITSSSWTDVSAEIKNRYVYAVTSVDSSAAANESAFSKAVEVFYILK